MWVRCYPGRVLMRTRLLAGRSAVPDPKLAQRCTSEFVGTAFLLAAVVGSGIMGDHLAGGNTAIALLANTIATAAALIALILTFGPISGAHMNPLVTLMEVRMGAATWKTA